MAKKNGRPQNDTLKRLTKEIERCEKAIIRDQKEIEKINNAILRCQNNLETVTLELKYDQERLLAAKKALEDAEKEAADDDEVKPPEPSLTPDVNSGPTEKEENKKRPFNDDLS